MIAYCEKCDSPICSEDDYFDGLCPECFADMLIDDTEEPDVREYLRYSFDDFLIFLRK